MSHTDLSQAAETRYQQYLEEGLALDMTRGKPAPDQLDLTNDMLTCLGADDYKLGGTDCRNYGGLDGLPEVRAFFAEFLEVAPAEVLIGGNSSLNLMYDAMVRAMLFGVPGSPRPWCREDKIKWLCPAPGYDRHFNICADLGIEMINVPMTDDGPDMAVVTRLVAEDAAVKGIWCVPRYANPTGITYSREVVKALAEMPSAAPDFRIFYDNAYQVHHLTDAPAPLANIMDACKAAGHADRVYLFGSTSKVTFAGAGLSALAASENNLAEVRRRIGMQTIGPDKINQLRHLRFLPDMNALHAHMRKHAAILKPKFEVVDEVLTAELGGTGLATWTKPEGGYFVSLDTRPGLADKVVAMAARAGVKLTGAGATYPYGKDPENRNIRIAPSLPSPTQIRKAMEVVCVCIKIASEQAEA